MDLRDEHTVVTMGETLLYENIFGAWAVRRSLDWILPDVPFGHGETNPQTDRSITW
jgi:hypothetical protein